MVLGLGLKKKGISVKVEFQIEVQEIKPWKATSGRNAPLLVQWQRGDNRSGRTKTVVPKQGDGGKLVFNDTFRLPAKLLREAEGRDRRAGVAKFKKKTIVFILQEAMTDQPLARCVVDLAEYGDLDQTVPACIPLTVGRKMAAGGQTPSLFLAIGPLEKKDDRSFASRVSFGSATPRSSISKAPEKIGSKNGKSRGEPDLDEDTRRSIVAALLSDDDDNVSIESFTDDDGTPGDSTPRSDTIPKSSTPGSAISTTSTTPPRAEAEDGSNAVPETIPKSVNKSSSSSSSSQTAILNSTERPVPLPSPTHGRPTPTKHGPGKAMQSAESVTVKETLERSRPFAVKEDSGKATESPKISAEEGSKSSSAVLASTSSITQLFSTVPAYKSTKDADNLASELVSHPSKDLPNSSGSPLDSRSQLSRAVKQPPSPEQGDKASRAALLSIDAATSTASKVSRSLVTSAVAPHVVMNKSTNGTGNSSSAGESQKPREIINSERPKSPKVAASAEKQLSQNITPPLPPVSTKAFAEPAAASAYDARKTVRSSEGSSSDKLNEIFDDSFSKSSNGGRSPAQTPSPDQTHVSGRSVSGSETSVYSKGSESKDADKMIISNISVKNEEEQKIVTRKSLDLNREVSNIGGGSKIPAVMKNIGVEPEAKRESGLKQEEAVEEGASVLGAARANLAKVEKRALEELRTKITVAEAKFLAESQKVEKFQGELRDIGAMEVSLYCVVAEHGNSSHKLHTPARRLARLYMHAYKHWAPERRAGTAKNSVSGLVTVAKSCGTDVSRLSFWWSNVVALRAVITQAFDSGLSSVSQGENAKANSAVRVNGNGSANWARARRSVTRSSLTRLVSKQTLPASPKSPSTDWQEASTYIAALEKIEEWIYSKIIESLWWQALIPRMQKNVDASAPTSPKGMAMLSPSALFGSEFTNKGKDDISKLAGDVTGIFVKKPVRTSASLPELGDARQGNMSVEVWKKAIMDALRRLCPVRGAGHDCGCLPMLIKMAIEGCVARLDVALFNAILREPEDDVPTDPCSDPVSDPSVLPISPGGLTFGGGSQLKNVVVTWSSFIAGLVSVKEPVFGPDMENGDNTDTSEDSEKLPKFFHLIKATGDLLMLPKDILMDRTIRKEICPMLSLQLIRRVLVNFVPDEFAPDPISPSLLAALNAEASIEKQRQGEADYIPSSIPMAAAPPISYAAPASHYVWSWIGESSTDPTSWGHSNNSLLRKGYTSDEDLTVMEQLQKASASDKLEFLMGNAMQSTANGNHLEESISKKRIDVSESSRFELLKEVWGTS